MNKERLLKSVRGNLLYLATGKIEKKYLERIIEAIEVVDRIFFVRDKEEAYFDTALSIGFNQTISQPSTVARMLMLAKLESGKNLLELGAGSGWNASLAGYLIYPGKVLSLDIVPQLIDKAVENLNSLRDYLNYEERKKLSNIEFKVLNIFKQLNIWQEQYDRVIITAGINLSQEYLIAQLAEKMLLEKGILVCPYTYGPLIILKKEEGRIIRDTTMEQYVFVPLLD
ncbi:MAG: methyltransferase domain-containing protein [Atribacterota bacterium]